MRTSLVCDAISMAAGRGRVQPGAIFHSDRGSQYTSAEFAVHLGAFNLRGSMGKVGQCWDNAMAESFFASLKNELVYRTVFPTRANARRAVAEYIEVFYNRTRLHSGLGYTTPPTSWRTRSTKSAPKRRNTSNTTVRKRGISRTPPAPTRHRPGRSGLTSHRGRLLHPQPSRRRAGAVNPGTEPTPDHPGLTAPSTGTPLLMEQCRVVSVCANASIDDGGVSRVAAWRRECGAEPL